MGALDEDRDSKRIGRVEEEVHKCPRARALLRAKSRLELTSAGSAVYQKWRGLHWVLRSLAELGYPRASRNVDPDPNPLVPGDLRSAPDLVRELGSPDSGPGASDAKSVLTTAP